MAYQNTVQKIQLLREAGYKVAERWEHKEPRPWCKDRCLGKRNKTYPHAIVYDFEAYQDKSKAALPTRDLSYESEHVPISVSIADTLNPHPEYICSKDPDELIQLLYSSLERRSAAIREDVAAKYMPPDGEGLPEKQCKLIEQWCNQVQVVGFNSGHYDLKLIRNYFVSQLAQENGVFAAEKDGRIMFIKTPSYIFLDIMNYLAPGITYDKWVKTYGATQTKSWLPYEWFDSADKLDYPGLPPYWFWYSELKNDFILSPKEYEECKPIFHERGMKTFGDWLEYYNNLDVSPFLEALQTMKSFYTGLGVDIFKDAVSLPGVSMQYVLRGSLRGRNPPALYAPGPEAYAMLKEAVVGGPSLVLTRKHVRGETSIPLTNTTWGESRRTSSASMRTPSTQARCSRKCPAAKRELCTTMNRSRLRKILQGKCEKACGSGLRKWTSKSPESCGSSSKIFHHSSSIKQYLTTAFRSICTTTSKKVAEFAFRTRKSCWVCCQRKRC